MYSAKFLLFILAPICCRAMLCQQNRAPAEEPTELSSTITGLAWSSSGKLLLSHASASEILWDVETNLPIKRWAYVDPLDSLIFRSSLCDDTALLKERDSEVSVEDFHNRSSHALPLVKWMSFYACAEGGQQMVGARDLGSLKGLSLQTLPDGKVLAQQAFQPSSSGNKMRLVGPHTVIGWASHRAFIWDWSGNSFEEWKTGPTESIIAAGLRGQLPIIASFVKSTFTVQVKEARSGKVILSASPCDCSLADIDTDGVTFAVFEKRRPDSPTGQLHTWDLATGVALSTTAANPFTEAIAVKPGGQSIAIGGDALQITGLPRNFGQIEVFDSKGKLLRGLGGGKPIN
jgi:hypothetical protein